MLRFLTKSCVLNVHSKWDVCILCLLIFPYSTSRPAMWYRGYHTVYFYIFFFWNFCFNFIFLSHLSPIHLRTFLAVCKPCARAWIVHVDRSWSRINMTVGCSVSTQQKWVTQVYYTVCPTRYRTLHFFNNSNTNEDIATKFEQEYVRCVRNEKECVCCVSVVRLIVATRSSGPPSSRVR